MRLENFQQLNCYLETEHNDLNGVIKMDTKLIKSMYELCTDYNFNVVNKLIVGFGLTYDFTASIIQKNEVLCSILYLDRELYGNSYEDVEKKLQSETNIVVFKKVIKLPYNMLGKYMQGFDSIATTQIMQSIPIFEIKSVDLI